MNFPQMRSGRGKDENKSLKRGGSMKRFMKIFTDIPKNIISPPMSVTKQTILLE